MTMKRVCLNLPSKCDIFHKYHGFRFLVCEEEFKNKDMVTIYNCENTDLVSLTIPRYKLSEGWNMTSMLKQRLSHQENK